MLASWLIGSLAVGCWCADGCAGGIVSVPRGYIKRELKSIEYYNYSSFWFMKLSTTA